MNNTAKQNLIIGQANHARAFAHSSVGMLEIAGVDPNKFAKCMFETMLRVPNIATADKDSFNKCLTSLMRDGLLPDGRQAALLVDKKNVVRYYPMKDGLKMMIFRACQAHIRSGCVYEGDKIKVTRNASEGDNVEIEEGNPFNTEKGKLTGVYCLIKVPGHPAKVYLMWPEDIAKIRGVSAQYNMNKEKSIWGMWHDQMAEKSVVKKAMYDNLHLISENDDAGQNFHTMLDEDSEFKDTKEVPPIVLSEDAVTDEEFAVAKKIAEEPTETHPAVPQYT